MAKDNENAKPKGFGKPKPGVCVPCWERRQKKRREEAKKNGSNETD